MNKNFFRVGLVAVVLAVIFSLNAFAQSDQPYKYKNKLYYKVSSSDPAMDTGKEVCAKAGLSCVGYTALTTDVCKGFHPGAKTVSDANGSKAGFYCDGSPQGGVCAKETDTCHICPTCNLNMDCDTQIGDLYRETFVECSDPTGAITASPGRLARFYGWASNWWGSLRSTVAQSFNMYWQKLEVLMRTKTVKHVKVQVTGPKGTVEADVPEDSYVCEFYQANKKLVTCGALAAADHFCVTAMNSQYAKATLCQDDGLIVCSNPCTTSPQQVKPKQCAFDNDRSRGKQASPLDFCNETKTIKVDMGGLGKKKAGQECAHGGECATGICLGKPSDNGIKYFCSCRQNAHDTSCVK